MLTIVGLGCDPKDISEGAKEALLSGARVILRTGETPAAEGVKALGVPFETLDALYAGCRNFDTLNKKLARAVLDAAKEGDTVYCVDGSACDDVSAQIVLQKSKGARVFAGVSKADAAFSAARVSAPSRSAFSAYAMPESRPLLPLCVYDADCDLVAGDAKLKLCDWFGDEAEAYFVRGGRAKKIKLYEADRQGEYDLTCCIVIPEIPLLKRTRFNYDDLLEIMRLLRAPDGCPWDRAQTHESIRTNMVEEAYELVDAIDCKDDDKICEEAGDVLMQGAFHSILGQERGAFSPEDVLSGVCSKLIFRHSHIFGKDKASDENSALSVWDKNKTIERAKRPPPIRCATCRRCSPPPCARRRRQSAPPSTATISRTRTRRRKRSGRSFPNCSRLSGKGISRTSPRRRAICCFRRSTWAGLRVQTARRA